MKPRLQLWMLGLALCALPLSASAHATPVSSTPASAQVLTSVPEAVSITFSEHVDAGASRLSVTGPDGKVISGKASIDASNLVFSAPLMQDGEGAYIVSWSVVSADDGHFTKGSYPFAVGSSQALAGVSASDTQIVEVSTAPEAVSSALELFGNGIVWAVLVLFAFAIRPLLRSGTWESVRTTVLRYCARVLYAGAAAVLCGGLLQLLVKAGDLAQLESLQFGAAFMLYIGTAAGSATLWRMLAVVAVALIYWFWKHRIQSSARFTWQEGALAACMCVFAYFRAVISHATANPFHPHISIAVNFVHLIEKDIWAGILLVLILFVLSERLHGFLMALIPRAFAMLAVDFAAVSVTASYIVWLHLKSFDNLFTTQWGGAFLELFAAALLMVAMRSYHVFARQWRPHWFAKRLPMTLAAEFACALLVIYFSSLVIITSPPLEQPQTPVYSAASNGLTITLERDAQEDGMVLLTESGGKAPLPAPTLTIEDTSTTLGPQSIALSRRWDGGYVFPKVLMAGTGPFTIKVDAPQQNGFDAQASFNVPKGAFDAPAGWQSRRSLDIFTFEIILFALAAAVFAAALWYVGRMPVMQEMPQARGVDWRAAGGFILALGLGLACTLGASSSGLLNPFKAECESDGNMWHLMLPSKAGVPTAQTPQEGCMWGMGNYMYMFADQREYDANRTPAQATTALTSMPRIITAGVLTNLTVSISNDDGSPATLFVDMEKLVHMVIVSKDETEFAHIHSPQTASPFTFEYTFPKAGEYLVSVDYAHGMQLESKQFKVEVGGSPVQSLRPQEYPQGGRFGGYDVSLKYQLPLAGQVSTLRYTITKDGASVTDLQQYLSAAMHISVVKNDFSNFIHLHGEVHPPGVPLAPIIVKNGQVVHTMAMMMNVPQSFGPDVEAHLIFPTAGLYTVWGEFKRGGVVVPTAFTVRVE